MGDNPTESVASKYGRKENLAGRRNSVRANMHARTADSGLAVVAFLGSGGFPPNGGAAAAQGDLRARNVRLRSSGLHRWASSREGIA